MANDAQIQQAYTAILTHLVETGRAPHHTELSKTIGVTPDVAKQLQLEAATAGVGCWISPETDYIGSWAPFSNIPTQYLISVGGKQKWYGQGGIESLAVRWLFPGQEVKLEVNCLDCGDPMTVRFLDDEILSVEPETIVGHVNVPLPKWGETAWWFNGMQMNLFRSEEHVKNWSMYDSVSEDAIMPLADWARVFAGDLFRKRLEPDYLSKMGEYRGGFPKTLGELGKKGSFWGS